MVAVIADDLRAAADNDAIHRNTGGNCPIPSRSGAFAEAVNTVAHDVQYGLACLEGSIGQQAPPAIDGLGLVRQAVLADGLVLMATDMGTVEVDQWHRFQPVVYTSGVIHGAYDISAHQQRTTLAAPDCDAHPAMATRQDGLCEGLGRESTSGPERHCVIAFD